MYQLELLLMDEDYDSNGVHLYPEQKSTILLNWWESLTYEQKLEIARG